MRVMGCVHRLGVLAGVFFLTSCGGSSPNLVVDGIEVYEHQWVHTMNQIGPRAAFDLDCPREQLEFTLFTRVRRYPTEVGVRGCGRRSTYVRDGVAPSMQFVGERSFGPWRMHTQGYSTGE